MFLNSILKNDTTKTYDLQDRIKHLLTLLPGIGDPLPPSWVDIRENLLLLKITDHFITFDRFREVCADYDITDPSVIRTLSGYFSRIGAITHYIDDPLLQERIYLDSNWLVNTVYEVLDNKEIKKKKGRLQEEDITAIWHIKELNFEVNKLTQLMHKFGLMYHIPQSKSYVVPEHLPTDKPYQEWDYEQSSDILRFIYEFDKYMPQGLMSRLIVSLHEYIHDHKRVWHRGLNIKLKETNAEIIESYGSANAFEIRIAGSNKIELLAIIREHFSEILKPFRNLKYKQLVPCICEECVINTIPQFHDYKTLLKLREKGKLSQCPGSGELVDVNNLLRITGYIKENGEKAHFDEQIDHTALKTIELFLASSSELKPDREQVEIWINRENKTLIKKGVFLKLNLREDFLNAMSQTRSQDEYNKIIAKCDVIIFLFSTKVGKYTEEEFEIANKHFRETGKPKYIYTYFKEVQVNASDKSIVTDLMRIKRFKKKLENLGHFYTLYKSQEDLTKQLKNQLDKIIEEISLANNDYSE